MEHFLLSGEKTFLSICLKYYYFENFSYNAFKMSKKF